MYIVLTWNDTLCCYRLADEDILSVDQLQSLLGDSWMEAMRSLDSLDRKGFCLLQVLRPIEYELCRNLHVLIEYGGYCYKLAYNRVQSNIMNII
jgi:hypothetical protein